MRQRVVICPASRGGGSAPRAILASLLACLLACAPDGGAGSGSGTAGTSGSAGTTGAAGAGATAGTGGTGGVAGTNGVAGTGGAAGSTATAGTTGTGGGTAGAAATAGTGGATAGRGGSAGAGTGGAAGRGGAAGTGTAGAAGRGGAAGTGTGGGATAGTTGTGGSAGACATPPAPSELIGWAALPGNNVTTTTGGGNATPQVVTTLQQFTTAVMGNTPAVIHVNGVLAAGRVNIGSNKTVVGICGAELHGHISISGSSNVIVRNIKIVGYGVGNCALDPSFTSTVGCSSGDDAVTIQSNAHHVWFDHCDVADGTDGNLDVVNGSDFVTISWTKFHYTPRTDNVGNDSTGANGHRFSNLIGSDDNIPGDVGHLNITWHHNWWAENVNQRMPRSRAGKIHMLNNLFTSTGNSYCTNAGQGAQLLVEGNVYNGVAGPLQLATGGMMRAPAGSNIFTNTSGTTTATSTGVFTPTYTYTAEPASGIQAAVMAGAGPK